MIQLVAGLLLLIASLFVALAGVTQIGAALTGWRHPPQGAFATVNGTRMHFVHVPVSGDATLPPLVFIHGASGNLLDPMNSLRSRFEGKAEMLFPDRPGHGWSERGAGNEDPFGQAATIAALMKAQGLGKSVIVGHSFGGAVALAFALNHPDLTAGLVLVSPASHPWPGGDTSWYYELTSKPVIGPIFANTFAFPAGRLRMPRSIGCVFSPNPVPDGYVRDAAISLVLRPHNFINNARDVKGLFDHVSKAQPRYGEIAVPLVVISGDRDTVVYEHIHTGGLERDLPGAKAVWVRNLGHKPDYVAPDLVAAAIGHVAGAPAELFGDPDIVAQQVEARLAGQDFGPYAACKDGDPNPVIR